MRESGGFPPKSETFRREGSNKEDRERVSKVIGNGYQEAPALSFLNTRHREPELKRSRESPESTKSGVQTAVIYQWCADDRRREFGVFGDG